MYQLNKFTNLERTFQLNVFQVFEDSKNEQITIFAFIFLIGTHQIAYL